MFGPLKRGLKRLVSRFGYEVVRPESLQERALAHHLGRLFRQLRVDCVLDVGANRGQYRNFLRDAVGYEGWIVSFEPLQRNVQILSAAAPSDPRWVVCGFALGRQDGHLDINVMRSDDFSSFLAPDSSIVGVFQELNVVDRKERVEIKRLDAVLPGLRAKCPMRNVYLKMDTQGFDLEVIEGAGAELAGICALQTELSVRRIYEGMPDYQEALRVVERKGFTISGIYPVTSDPAMRVIEFDCILVNAASSPNGTP